jgi:hypothetical protein
MAMAVGSTAIAVGSTAIAVGFAARAVGFAAIAVGYAAIAVGSTAIAVDFAAIAVETGDQAVRAKKSLFLLKKGQNKALGGFMAVIAARRGEAAGAIEAAASSRIFAFSSKNSAFRLF